MRDQLRFDQDWHVSSTFSDGTATVEENVHAAENLGLTSLCIVDRASRASGWVGDLAEACRLADRDASLTVNSGVEVEVLDSHGSLDVPFSAGRADHLFVGASRLPTPTGPMDPEMVRQKIERGELLASRAVEWLVRAYANATRRRSAVVLAHPFSVLPWCGIDPEGIHPAYLRWLAGEMQANGATSEVNESWHAPGPAALDSFLTAGVTVLPASGARSPQAVGRFAWAPKLPAGLSSLARVA
jgi:hypothetical protein